MHTYEGSGSFGELALMYNMPRAASVRAQTSGQLWAMDRHTFRRILLKSAFKKRKLYEDLLEKVPMLKALQVCVLALVLLRFGTNFPRFVVGVIREKMLTSCNIFAFCLHTPFSFDYYFMMLSDDVVGDKVHFSRSNLFNVDFKDRRFMMQ